MSKFKVVFYEAKFHTVTIEADDERQAEDLAREIVQVASLGTSKSRGLVRWSVEPTDR